MRRVAVGLWSVLYMSMSLSSFAIECDEQPAALQNGPMGTVIAVPDGSTLILDNDVKVRLIGIQAPKLSKGRDDVTSWPMAEESRLALLGVSLGKTVKLRFGGAKRDRHERVLAQVFIQTDDDNEVWLQEYMLNQGLARVYSFADNRACLDQLYTAEGRARANRLGLWQHSSYAIMDAGQPELFANRAGRYEVVEGRVLNADRVGSRIYLNFGRYWKEDVTVVIERNAQKMFKQVDLDPLTLANAFVRVRGWIDLHDGPRIDVTHPEQIEILAKK